nr:glycoside hydrolase family 3 C-terminal domain-containing protein [Tessaracoccus coleopterorum]
MLRNEGDLLPLSRTARIAVIGAFAESPRYQGAGSSLINPTRLDIALDEIRSLADGDVAYAPGFSLDGTGDAAALRAEAVAVAADAEVVVAFLGLPASLESEGFDRDDIDLPATQLELLDAVRAANPNVVVVLSNGGVVALPFRDDVPAIVETWLLGQGGGHATAQVLFGDVNPSGRLTETIPLDLRDTRATGTSRRVRPRHLWRGLLVGYRSFDARGLEVAYPFGHGLSYTTFGYGPAEASVAGDGGIVVRVPVRNTGTRDGREVVQVYTSLPGSVVSRAPQELTGFASVEIPAGAERVVEIAVARKDLAYWDTRVDHWVVEGGTYTVAVGASSRDLRTSASVEIAGDEVRVPLTPDSSIGEALANPVAGPIMRAGLGEAFDGELLKMMMSFPLGRLVSFPGSPMTQEQLDALLGAANA